MVFRILISVYCHIQSEDVAVKSLQCNIRFSDVCIKDLINVRLNAAVYMQAYNYAVLYNTGPMCTYVCVIIIHVTMSCTCHRE